MAVNGHLSDVSRFSAIDGRTLDIHSLVQNGLANSNILSTYTLGAVGLAMSHVALWDIAIKTRTTLTVCEDDAIFNDRFDLYSGDVIKRLPSGWDLISWGWNFDLFVCFEMLPNVSFCLAQFEQDRLKANVERFQNQAIDPQAYRLKWAFGTPCYTVTPKGAHALRSKCVPLQPTITSFAPGLRVAPYMPYFKNVGIDSAMNSVWSQLNAYLCFPPLVVTKNETSKSTVQT